jgi:signal transduction histidine kinase
VPSYDNRELEHRAREVSALTEVAKTLAAPLDLPDLLNAAMKKLAESLEGTEVGIIFLWEDSSGVFRPAASFGCDFEFIREIGLRAGESIAGPVCDQGIPLLFNTPAETAAVLADMRPANRHALFRAHGAESCPSAVLAVPLQIADRKIGMLMLETLRGTRRYAESDLTFAQTLAHFIALAVDRDRLEMEAAAAHDTHEADRLRSEVMAILSHELRTPLATIKGFSTALLLEEASWSEDKRREFLHLIDAECDNLQAMLNDILDSALIDVGRLAVERQPVRLQHLAREVADEMQPHTSIHRLVVSFPPDFPIVDADPRRVKQVIRNIVDNAIKYSPEGGLVVIDGRPRPTDVVVSISDQGVGISPEDLIPLFEKYFRVKSPTGYHVAGTGLGLPVARAIVEAHGGRIWAESKLGEGTTLFFSLPRTELRTQLDEE